MTPASRGPVWRERVAVALPPLVLLTMAAIQMILVASVHLSPWKGGGFGMFASVDSLPFRSVRIEVSAPARSERLDVPPSLMALADRAATLPNRRALARLADGVIARERRYGRPVEQVRVEVWRAEYSSSLASVWTKITDLSVIARDKAGKGDRGAN